MRNRTVAFVAGMVVACVTGVAGVGLAQGPGHRVVAGDTLWDLSAHYWQDASLWPDLWALNPQLHNPHWIEPGEVLRLDRVAPADGQRRVIHLPLERLSPEAPAAARLQEDAAATGAAETEPQAAVRAVRVSRQQTLDFVSSHRLNRLGVLSNRHQVKVVYGSDEDVEVDLTPGAQVRPGDRLTLFDDRRPVRHPESGHLAGYFVKIYGHMEVLGVVGDRAVGRVVEAYDGIEADMGLMAYREPFSRIELQEAAVGVEGLILCGRPESSVFATDDVVYLDKGTLHGLQPGVVLEVPVREGRRAAQGMVDLGLPLATLVVLTAEEKSAAGLIVASRAAVEHGDRFIAAPFSP